MAIRVKVTSQGKGWYMKIDSLLTDEVGYMPVNFKGNPPEHIPNSNGFTDVVIELEEAYFYVKDRKIRLGVKGYKIISHSNGKDSKRRRMDSFI